MSLKWKKSKTSMEEEYEFMTKKEALRNGELSENKFYFSKHMDYRPYLRQVRNVWVRI